ncbi:MAG TPA: glucose-1-phosphate cytidylyltransferase [Kiritimatiellia bacterium]|nr:glucose-1-phosphate cytidylyltransferase [Kiritimatiellia bacterium]
MINQKTDPKHIPVVILAGGRGTRLMEETQTIPKPMVSIGGKPMLLHIMRYYSAYGFRKFVLCLGYKGHIIKDYFLDIHKHTASLIVNGKTGEYKYHTETAQDWEIQLIETGEHSLTGTRLQKAGAHIDAPHFCLTYGDGLCDVDLGRELEFHLKHGKTGTVAAVHPPSRFGRLDIAEDGRVQSFREKETLTHDFINGGYFIFKREFLDRLPASDNYSLESEPLARLAEDGKLCAYRHEGFWMCMDTMRDRETLEKIYESGKAPWARA